MSHSEMLPLVTRSEQGRKFNVLGHAISNILTHAHTNGTTYVFECITPPGQGIPPHVHEHEDEIIVIASGEYSVMIGDRTYNAVAGDVCYFPRGTAHAFQNVGARAGVTVWTIIPGGPFEQFFNELSQLPAEVPDLGRVIEIFARYGMTILLPAEA